MHCSACGNDPPSSSGPRRKARKRRARATRTGANSGRYVAARRSETEYEPGSRGRVLRNLLGIRSAREMARIEDDELTRTMVWAVGEYKATHRFTAQDLCALHRHWLGSIYPWAGEYRQVNVSKGGFLFAAASLIPHLMMKFESECLRKHTPLRAQALLEIAAALAETHTELVLIHPFRDGNGRLARLLAVLMAAQAGFPAPAFEIMRKRRETAYFAAVQAGLDRNYTPMSRLFASLIGSDDEA
jgi:cell filamentation protein